MLVGTYNIISTCTILCSYLYQCPLHVSKANPLLETTLQVLHESCAKVPYLL